MMKVIRKQNSSQICYGFIGEINYKQFYVQVFNKQALQRFNLTPTIEFNQHIFSNTHEMIFPQNFLPAVYSYESQNIIVTQQPFQYTLQERIQKSRIKQSQALQIFDQVLKAIYSLTLNQFQHRNIRPEHFVLHNKKWKLKSIVWTDEIQGYNGQYAWDPKYQAPQEYQNTHPYQDTEGKNIIWYLGSLLLDMIYSCHRLGDQNKINKFKNKQFSIQAIGGGVDISKELADCLAKLLHYNRQSRMSIKQLFSNTFLSKDVSAHFKKNQQLSENQNLLQMSQKNYLGQSGLRSTLRTTSHNEVQFNMPQNNIPQLQYKQFKGQIENQINKNMGKYNLMKSKAMDCLRCSQNIQQVDQMLANLHLQSNINKDCQKMQIQNDFFGDLGDLKMNSIRPKSYQNVNNCLKIYQNKIDRMQFLWITADKIKSIPFKENIKQQIILLNKFSLYYASLIQLQKIMYALNYNKNIYQINEQIFAEYIASKQYENFKEKQIINLQLKKKIFDQISQKLIKFDLNTTKLLKDKNIQAYIKQRSPNRKHFNDIKLTYRTILLQSYKVLSACYNETKDKQICKKCMYIVYCLTYDKLYIQKDIKDNFKFFLEGTKDGLQMIDLKGKIHQIIKQRQFQLFIQNSTAKLLINYSKFIFEKYYNI